MIIDLILDRLFGFKYNAREFYMQVQAYGETFGDIAWDITRAMDGGDEEDVKRELRYYIISQEYNPAICDYIDSVNWLNEE